MEILPILLQAATDPSGPFQEGSGIAIGRYRGLFVVALTIGLVCWGAWVVFGLKQQWGDGQIRERDLIRDVLVTVGILVVMGTLFFRGL